MSWFDYVRIAILIFEIVVIVYAFTGANNVKNINTWKFKKGDKVMFIGNGPDNTLYPPKGSIGKIKSCVGIYVIRFELGDLRATYYISKTDEDKLIKLRRR